ncbi:MAG: hypothetical protein L3K16_08650 [Thermoplasmata archaeon]|nr:hypothetical protein [Thermoplasmata archaeon]
METFDLRSFRHQLNGPARQMWACAGAMVVLLEFVIAAALGHVPTLSGTFQARILLLGLALPVGALVLAFVVATARRVEFHVVELGVDSDALQIRDAAGSVEVVPYSERAARNSSSARLIGVVDRTSIPGQSEATRFAVVYRRASGFAREVPVPLAAFEAILKAMSAGGPPRSPETRLGPNGVGQVRAWSPLP